MTEDMNVNEQTKTLQEGDTVKGTVKTIEEKAVEVVLEGTDHIGIIPISELSSLHIEQASDAVAEGEELELIVTKVEEEQYILSKRQVDAEKAWEELQVKFDNGDVIETEVKDVVKGGLVVDLGVRGFIPASLVEDYFVESFEDYKGRTMKFKIVEMDPEQNRLILSHRLIVEEEKAQQKQQVLEQLEAGQVIEDAVVQRLASFGAFVDIGGVDGLVHISEIAHEHVEEVSDKLSEGDRVNVKVLSVDPAEERISLSIKETLPGPWENIEAKISEGDVLDGQVKRIVEYGAFVEVLPGVEGLVHISRIAHEHIESPEEKLSEGEKIQVKVLDVNPEEERLSLSIKDLLDKPENDEPKKASVQQQAAPVVEEESTGFSFGDMLDAEELKKLSEE